MLLERILIGTVAALAIAVAANALASHEVDQALRLPGAVVAKVQQMLEGK